MADISQVVSLNQILENSENVVLDTSAVNHCLDESRESKKTGNRIKHYQSEIDLLNFLIGYVDSINYRGNILITPDVCEELLADPKRFSISRRERNNGRFTDSNPELDHFYKVVSKAKSKRRTFVSILEAKNGILNFKEKEERLFAYFQSRYSYLKKIEFKGSFGKGLSLGKKLSDTDFKIVGSIWTISQTRDKITLVTNDFPILYSTRSLFLNDKFRGEKVSLFFRFNHDKYAFFKKEIK